MDIKNFILLLPLLTLSGCWMSEEDKDNIAKVTCSIISETGNMDTVLRVKEINSARKEIGEEPYLDGDEGIREALEYGVCENLVKNDVDYSNVLKKEKENVRIAEAKRLEEALIDDKLLMCDGFTIQVLVKDNKVAISSVSEENQHNHFDIIEKSETHYKAHEVDELVYGESFVYDHRIIILNRYSPKDIQLYTLLLSPSSSIPELVDMIKAATIDCEKLDKPML